jgi:hypothetical protein
LPLKVGDTPVRFIKASDLHVELRVASRRICPERHESAWMARAP